MLAFDDELLVDHVINATAEKVDDLLDDSEETSTRRSFLKNLSFCCVTLARNTPLKHRMIGLKELPIQVCDRNKSSWVIPLISKVLNQTQASRQTQVSLQTRYGQLCKRS